MKVLTATQVALDSPRAHAINATKTAGGFARLGLDVQHCCGTPESTDRAGALSDLGEDRLQIRRWDGFVDDNPRKVEEAFGKWFGRVIDETSPDFVYARHFSAAMESVRRGITTVLETHAYIDAVNPLLDMALGMAGEGVPLWVTTISERLREHYIERGAEAGRVFVTPDGVDLELFTPPPISLGRDWLRVVYAGHLYDYKGIPAMLDAAAMLPRVTFELVGGMPEDVERVREEVEERELTNVNVYGRVAHRDVPSRLWDAGALLLVPSAEEPSKDWTSPVKLGEYLASGTPIVASSIPALHDWLDDLTAWWCEPDDPVSLAQTIGQALSVPDTPARAAARKTLAEELSYTNRARRMLEACGLGDEIGEKRDAA